MDIKNIINKNVLYVILAFILALLIFQFGMFVGYKRAEFSFGWGDKYFSTFGERQGPHIPGLPGDDLSNSHGISGKIIKIELPNLVVEDQDKVEKMIVINDDSSIKKFREDLKSTDLQVGEFVVVIGSPNDNSQVEAKLIRLMPDPDEFLPPPPAPLVN